MRKSVSRMERLMATVLSVFLAIGLGLIGPASALADVERGGLDFTIVSDDLAKTASGSMPTSPRSNLNDGGDGGSGGGGAAAGGELPGGDGGSNEPAPAPAIVAPPWTGGGVTVAAGLFGASVLVLGLRAVAALT